ncbi:ATPase, AAA family [Mycoplasma leachii PG50]|uniref:ATPase, AAA family n=2 Tax=Mycoplasma leachii TaxID=2105 RepID=E4PTF6_MYCLG|nr:ATP-binding protein [Mycoplasma leachii]ADR24618.1 ATPase, AAA family [Mycoplasma leachii PG50]PTD31077.1 AAA family ATPase [Mycoplasma leachii 06049]
MKKANVLNLIRYHIEENDISFRKEARIIAEEFYKMGDDELGEYVLFMLRDANHFVPQIDEEYDIQIPFTQKIELEKNNEPLPLPQVISEEIKGVINAISKNRRINKFLFQGFPGTGKTETVKQIARILNRNLFMVDFNNLIDSRLGQSSKNIAELFQKINETPHPKKNIICFDEIDALALDRTNKTDLREMGRVTTAVFQGLDKLDSDIIVFATTNLFKHFDKALIRRFDLVIDFNRYSKEDMLDIAEIILKHYIKKVDNIKSELRLFRKIVSLSDELIYPGDLKNIIKSSIYLSDPKDQYDYLKKIYKKITDDKFDIKELNKHNFTVREIEILKGLSKSSVAIKVKELNLNE